VDFPVRRMISFVPIPLDAEQDDFGSPNMLLGSVAALDQSLQTRPSL
jgi:hypothetical protein